jgi:RNA polymerase sigma-54 factor
MAGNINQRLEQKLQQKLSPQQIQLMKLLQVPTALLDQRIKEEMEINPALESGPEEESVRDDDKSDEDETDEVAEVGEEEEIDLSEYLSDDDTADYKLKDTNYPDPDEERTIPIKVTETFHEYLLKQLGLLESDERLETIGKQLIGSIGDDGYLRRDMESIMDDLAFSQNIIATKEEIEEVLSQIQEFDPPGIGATNLRECLLLQLERKDAHPETLLAYRILDEYFEEFSKKHYEKLKRRMKITDGELKGAVDEILKLNPKPGGSFGGSSKIHQYIVPDFIIENINGELELRMARGNTPELKISNHFKEMIRDFKNTKKKEKKQKEAMLFIKQKIDSAKWFIDAIKQRQQTLYNTMHTIMKYQYDFFLTGDETNLKPMILKDIADIIHMDISTVSRVSNSKYVQTEFGTFPLKYFFSESLTTESGEEVSTREVKRILIEMIEGENKKKPLSDQKLMEFLKEKGYNIARRTVAKYREQLDIPVARLRKEL